MLSDQFTTEDKNVLYLRLKDKKSHKYFQKIALNINRYIRHKNTSMGSKKKKGHTTSFVITETKSNIMLNPK